MESILEDEYLKWICGYANASGGTIYIGTDDKGRVYIYAGPLPEYDINPGGIMVLCNASDRYLRLNKRFFDKDFIEKCHIILV